MDKQTRIKAIELLARSDELQAAGDLSAAESALQEALREDPENLESLYAAARFYSRAVGKPETARDYAAACRKRAVAISAEMDQILGSRKALSARHLGGIIGPY
jgi:Tfp pilus assembly protein PilF